MAKVVELNKVKCGNCLCSKCNFNVGNKCKQHRYTGVKSTCKNCHGSRETTMCDFYQDDIVNNINPTYNLGEKFL